MLICSFDRTFFFFLTYNECETLFSLSLLPIFNNLSVTNLGPNQSWAVVVPETLVQHCFPMFSDSPFYLPCIVWVNENLTQVTFSILSLGSHNVLPPCMGVWHKHRGRFCYRHSCCQYRHACPLLHQSNSYFFLLRMEKYSPDQVQTSCNVGSHNACWSFACEV